MESIGNGDVVLFTDEQTGYLISSSAGTPYHYSRSWTPVADINWKRFEGKIELSN